MKKIILMLGTILCINGELVFAQVINEDPIEMMFSEDPNKMKMNFSVQVNKSIALQISFTDVRDWKGEQDFRRILLISQEQLNLYQDSIKLFANSKHLEVSIPASGLPVVSRYYGSVVHNNLRVKGEGKVLQALKTAKDTFKVLEIFDAREFRNFKYNPKIQYLFSAKNINELTTIFGDENWIESTAHLIDSVVEIYSRKWKRPDLVNRSLYVKYDTAHNEKPIRIARHQITGENRMAGILTANVGVGIALMRNELSVTSNFGIQAEFGEHSYSKRAKFIRFSMLGYTRYEQQADKNYFSYGPTFLNIEYGWKNKQSDMRRQYLFSLGFGYRPLGGGFDPLLREAYRYFLNYGLNKKIILHYEHVTGKNGWNGVGVNFQLF